MRPFSASLKRHGGQGKQKKIHLGENLFDLRVIKHWHMMVCENSLIGVTQNLTGHSPEQSAVVDTALSRAIGLDGLQKFLPTLSIIGLHGFLKKYITLLNQKTVFIFCNHHI